LRRRLPGGGTHRRRRVGVARSAVGITLFSTTIRLQW
jgi:hypothetical protein